ncbi:hypothetical protein IWQ56_002944, partial [Coemansia nantahalensis]
HPRGGEGAAHCAGAGGCRAVRVAVQGAVLCGPGAANRRLSESAAQVCRGPAAARVVGPAEPAQLWRAGPRAGRDPQHDGADAVQVSGVEAGGQNVGGRHRHHRLGVLPDRKRAGRAALLARVLPQRAQGGARRRPGAHACRRRRGGVFV